jgi:hypothetical protein
MAEPAQYAWQQLPRETDKVYQAFVVYRNLEPQERPQAGVASECTKSVSLIRRWSSQWSWVERAREWNAHQEMGRLEARIEEKQRMDEEHLKIIRAMRSKALQALAQMETETLASNMYELRNMDHRLHQVRAPRHGRARVDRGAPGEGRDPGHDRGAPQDLRPRVPGRPAAGPSGCLRPMVLRPSRPTHPPRCLRTRPSPASAAPTTPTCRPTGGNVSKPP